MSKKLFVGTKGFDDVGAVLARMGQGFEYQNSAKYRGVPATEAIVFMNCGGSALGPDELRKFVEAGGTVYASDLQASVVAQAFRDVFECKTGGMSGTLTATVIDQGLAAIVGPQVDLTFNMFGWQYLIPKAGAQDKVRVYLEANRKFMMGWGAPQGKLPIVLSYETGQGGTLFFTAFHNVVQKSGAEQELLRFLLFRPMLARDLQRQREEMAGRAAKVQREFAGGLSKATPDRSFALDQDDHWTASLSWTGQGKLRVELLDPGGSVIAAQENWSAPLAVSGRVRGGGQVRVRCTEFVQAEIPFSLVIATGGGTGSPTTPAAAPAAPPATPTTRPGQTLTLEADNGRTLVLRIATDIGKHVLGTLGDDSRFFSDKQFRLSPDASGAWRVEPNTSATNATLLNGAACTTATALKSGDVLAVGNPVKGVIKLPLKVRVE